ncbi:MAG: shikimate dehydrogenase [Anaerolineaceae bacterium]|jgi:shikimate dehydrogenase|nr:shikimate dehydrogenase [Anaerolineaceae bacterium]
MPEQRINLGLIGWPLDHSLSPRIHQAALQELGLAGRYCLYAIEPNHIQDVAILDLLEHVAAGEIDGLNVTLPYKQPVVPLLAALTPSAECIGAVNTIYMENGLLTGDNTDAAGFQNDLQQLPVEKHTPALLLGAGGAARAVLFSLLKAGYSVGVAARNLLQAQELAHSFNAIANTPVEVLPLEKNALSQISRKIGLLVNATPLGMSPDTETCPWPEDLALPLHACVYDLVYNPVDTLLVRRACQAGLPARSGLGMLVEQAALAFERWTGYTAPRAVMRQAVQDACEPRIRQTSQRKIK